MRTKTVCGRVEFLSRFRVNRTPFSQGGMSDTVYTAIHRRSGERYFLKFGNLGEVVAEVVFNGLAHAVGLPSLVCPVIVRDCLHPFIRSPFIIGTREVKGEVWRYTEEDVLKEQYIQFCAVKAMMQDDDSMEFIRAGDLLYSIDNSESCFSAYHLEFVFGKEFVLERMGEAAYRSLVAEAQKVAKGMDVKRSFLEIYCRIFRERRTEQEYGAFSSALDRLAALDDETLRGILEPIALAYGDETEEVCFSYLTAMRQAVREVLKGGKKAE